MQNTNEQDNRTLTPKEIQALVGLADIDLMEINANIKAQQVQDKISKDETLTEKIDLLVSVLKSDTLESVGVNVVRKKLEQLVNRL